MKKITFDEEEMFVIAVFNPDTRSNTIHIMSEVLPELKDDQDMFDLLLSAIQKNLNWKIVWMNGIQY